MPGGLWAAASASCSIFKHAACKAFPSPCTFVPVWTCRSHSYCDARATETSFPSGGDWLRYILWTFSWHSTALGAILSKYYEDASTCYQRTMKILPHVINMCWHRSIKDVVVRTLISHPTTPHRAVNVASRCIINVFLVSGTCVDNVVSRTWSSGR